MSEEETKVETVAEETTVDEAVAEETAADGVTTEEPAKKKGKPKCRNFFAEICRFLFRQSRCRQKSMCFHRRDFKASSCRC